MLTKSVISLYNTSNKILFKRVLVVFLLSMATIANAQYTKIHEFTGSSNGRKPDGTLISVGAYLFGITKDGGKYERGTIFKVKPDGTDYTTLFHFEGGVNGSKPIGSLVYDGTSLYGVTISGGSSSNGGTIFKINPDGSSFFIMHDFTNSINGSDPSGSLYYDGTFLYGVARGGGAFNYGVIYKILPDGTNYTKLFSFGGVTSGSYPTGTLISDGNFLYGMTKTGGTNSFGTIFKILPNGSGYSNLLNFSGLANGLYPNGSLFYDGVSLYGMTNGGGVNNQGVIFKISPNGSNYNKLLDFDSTANGCYPFGSLISDGVFLYGMTYGGGINNLGTYFKIMPDGTGYNKLLEFNGISNGSNPYGSFLFDGTYFYGMTSLGGAFNIGSIFKILPDGTNYTKLSDFMYGPEGFLGTKVLCTDGTFLYGTTLNGGLYDYGTIYRIMPDGSNYSKLLDFSGVINGARPYGPLMYDGTFLYGMTELGGTSNYGTIFKILPNGSNYSKLLDFNGSSNGSWPQSSLISDGTFLYGMTTSGNNDDGTIFKIKPDGTGYLRLHDFDYTAEGVDPYGSLIYDGTFLYGTLSTGSTYGGGSIFKIKPDGTAMTLLLSCNTTVTGDRPSGSLIFDGTFFYGTFYNGPGYGNVFKIKPDGTGFSILHKFIGTTKGYSPYGDLVSDGTFLYGITAYGGAYNDGTLFRVKMDGTNFSELMDFTANGSFYSHGSSLIYDGTFLYGVTLLGGTYNTGTVYKFDPCAVATIQSITICSGQNFAVGNNIYTASGTYIDTLTSVSNCDSIITTNLTVLPSNNYYQSMNICEGQNVAVGNNIYTMNGVYTDIFTSVVTGCDSTITTTVIVNPLPIVTLTLSNDTICLNAGVFTLTGGLPLGGTFTGIGVNNSDFNQYVAGIGLQTIFYSYTDLNNCTNTDTVQIWVDSCDEISALTDDQQITIFPNPTTGIFTIEIRQDESELLITNVLGDKIISKKLTSKKSEIELSNQPSGIYFISIKSDKGILNRKIFVR